jgi:hypothetical protein
MTRTPLPVRLGYSSVASEARRLCSRRWRGDRYDLRIGTGSEQVMWTKSSMRRTSQRVRDDEVVIRVTSDREPRLTGLASDSTGSDPPIRGKVIIDLTISDDEVQLVGFNTGKRHHRERSAGKPNRPPTPDSPTPSLQARSRRSFLAR